MGTKTTMSYNNHYDVKEEGSATRVCGAKLFTKLFPNTNNNYNKKPGSSSSVAPFLTLTPSAVGTMSDSQHEHSDHHHHHHQNNQDPSKDLFVVGSSIGTESFGSDAAANMENNNNKKIIVVEGLGQSSSPPPATSSSSAPAINDLIAEDFFEQRLSNNSERFLQFNPTILQDMKMMHGKATTTSSTKNEKTNQGSRLNLPSLSSHIISKMDTAEKDNELISLSEHVRKTKIFGENDGDDKVEVGRTSMKKKTMQAKQSDDDTPAFPPFQLEEWMRTEVNESRTDDGNSSSSNSNNGQRLETLDEERETLQSEKIELAKEMEEFRNDLLQLKASLKMKNRFPVQLSKPTVVVPNPSVQGGSMEYAGDQSIEMVSTAENVGRRFKKDWSLGFGQDGDEDKILMEEPSFIDDKKMRDGDDSKTKTTKSKSRTGTSLKPASESSTDSASEVSTPELTEEILPGKKTNDFEPEEKLANDQRIQDNKAKDRNPSACNLVQIAEQQGAVFAALHYESNSMNIGTETSSQKTGQIADTATNTSKNIEKKMLPKPKRNEEPGSSKKVNSNITLQKQSSPSLAKTSKKTRKSGSKDDSLDRDEDEYARDMEQVQKLLKKYGFQKKSTKKFPSSYQDMEPHFGKSSQDDEDQAVVEIENLSAVSEHTSLYSDTDDPDLGFQMHAELCQKGTWKSNGSVHSGKRSSLRPRKYNASSSQSSRSKLESILKADDVESSDRVRFKKSIQSRVIVGGVHYDDEIRISSTPTPDPHDMSTIEERQDESESTPYGDLGTSRDGSPSPEKKKVDSLIQYWECQGSN